MLLVFSFGNILVQSFPWINRSYIVTLPKQSLLLIAFNFWGTNFSVYDFEFVSGSPFYHSVNAFSVVSKNVLLSGFRYRWDFLHGAQDKLLIPARI